jgi:cytochrome oxidase Cu insertion factor (SCO1/SenC/PrrC family)/mono/diheme cytochrome c family protein
MRRVMTAALAAFAILSTAATGEAQMRRGPEFFPNLPVVNQNGETLKFYDDLIKDKIVIVMFIYTSCTDICPLTTARMTLIEDKLGNAVGRDIFIVSMTVDPEVDTPEKLKAYSKSFATGPGWTFVTGKPEDIRAINYRLGERSKVLSDHRNEIVLGNDVTGEWQRDNVMGDLDRVVTTIREMDPNWRAQVQPAARNAAMNTGLAMGTQPGQAMYKKICAPCHTIGVGDKVGPDLRGVTERRERAWLVRYLRNPPAMLAANDPVARELAAKFDPVRMPNLRLSEQDADDLIGFLHQENAKLVEAPAPARPHEHRH